jgi:acyl-CoA thioester hydrolase
VKRRRYIEATIGPGSIDYLGHMTYLEYQRMADLATDALWAELTEERDTETRAGAEFAIVDLQVRYRRELNLGDRVVIETRVVGYDSKRMAVQHEVLRGEEVCCRLTFVAVSFHLSDRKVRNFPPYVLEHLAQLYDPLPEAPMPALRIPHPA